MKDDDEQRQARRLAKYARYRVSVKGWQRTLKYNASPAHLLACRRWRETHPRTEASYQTASGHWRNPIRIAR